jgi:eukaryotic-like serine/threonine-protein kinase
VTQSWTPDAVSEDLAGTRLGRYQLLFPLASGGMGAVWVARLLSSEGVGRIVALKVMLNQSPADADVQAFFAEAKVTARLDHPNVVRTLELGQERGTLFIAMELVRGQSLRKVIVALAKQRRVLPLGLVVSILRQAATGLHAAHELSDVGGTPLRLIHRDLSPDNILLSYAGRAYVSDFGVAKLSTTASTHTGTIKGKFAYMSPEQVSAEPLDRRSDLFALGVLLWEALTGRRLFKAPTPREIVALVLQCKVDDPRKLRPDIPAPLAELTLKCLAPTPAGRYSTADEVARELRRIARESGLTADDSELADLLDQLFPGEATDLTRRLDDAERSHGVAPSTAPTAAVSPEPTGGTLASQVSDLAKRKGRGRLTLAIGAIALLGGSAAVWWTLGASRSPEPSSASGSSREPIAAVAPPAAAPAPTETASADAAPSASASPRRAPPAAPRPAKPSKKKPKDDLFEDL